MGEGIAVESRDAGVERPSLTRSSGRRSRDQLPLPFDAEPSPRERGARRLRTVGLFAGVGGIELGLSSAGHKPLLMCEIDRIAGHVLAKRFPEVEKHQDVCTLRDLPADTELLAGGFPCQDLSQAGATRGIDGMRSGLVREALRLAAKRKVPWLLLENVPFMLQLGRGRALEVIVGALEDLGYRWAYRVVDTRAFGLPQRRERVFLVASLVDDPRRVLFADEAGAPEAKIFDHERWGFGFYWTEGIRGLGGAVDAVPTLKGGSTVGVPSPPAIWLPKPQEGIVTPSITDAERMQGFRAGWTKPAEEVAKPGMRWKLVGNAVSVPVIRWIGRRLARPGNLVVAESEPHVTGGMWPRAAFNVGGGRRAVNLSAWPVREPGPPLHEFVHGRTPLSRRATFGFLERTRRGSLNFPEGFIPALHAHLEAMTRLES